MHNIPSVIPVHIVHVKSNIRDLYIYFCGQGHLTFVHIHYIKQAKDTLIATEYSGRNPPHR